MCYWLDVKKERKKKSFDQVIREYLRKHEEDKQGMNKKSEAEQKRRARRAKEANEQQQNHITKDQFVFLFDSIKDI